MMLAIVIPYYKLTFFGETLKSLEEQTDKRFKVYIGDDASPENPKFLINQYKGKFELIYKRFKKNIGGVSLTKQWERCLALSKEEEWIMILCDDDYLGESVVANWYNNYNIFFDKVDVVRFSTKMINEKNQIITDVYEHPIWEKGIDSYYRRYKGLTRSTLSEYVFSRKAYLNFGFYNFPLGWHSDDRMWLDFSSERGIYSINESLIFIRISEINISGRKDNIDSKILAEQQFLKYIIINKTNPLNRQKRLEFLLSYESSIKKTRTLKGEEWNQLFFLYLKNFKIFPFVKFIRRFLICTFKL